MAKPTLTAIIKGSITDKGMQKATLLVEVHKIRMQYVCSILLNLNLTAAIVLGCTLWLS